jgi:voltage-gated potassium channel
MVVFYQTECSGAMTWVQQIGVAVLLVVLTLCLQCAGVAALIRWLRAVASDDLQKPRMSYSAALIMRATISIIILQGTIILLWACCYRCLCVLSWNSAFYFSATSYSTLGCGDVALSSKWRLLGPLESMLGVLMCGISVSLLFALITHLVKKDPELGGDDDDLRQQASYG